MTLPWAIRTAMVGIAAAVAYLLVQTDVTFEPMIRVILGAVSVVLASLNPVSLAERVTAK